MKGTVHYEVRGNVALMTIDNPPVNPLSSGVRQGLHDGLTQALADDAVAAIVLTGAGRAFIAGADISEFGGKSEGPSLGDCLAAMDNSSKPIVAAINGTAFGGGLEVALCCHYRVIAPSAPVGLPEVKLGLLPGAGGTQRLPRLIGAEKALSFILSGDPIPGPAAVQMGIADHLSEAILSKMACLLLRTSLRKAVQFAESEMKKRLSDRLATIPRSLTMRERTPHAKCASVSRRK